MNLSLKKGIILYSSKCNKLYIFSMVGALHYITDEFTGNYLLMLFNKHYFNKTSHIHCIFTRYVVQHFLPV